MINKNAKIFVAESDKMIGAALVEYLKLSDFDNIVAKPSSELKLTNQNETYKFFLQEKPEYVFMTTSEEGGILANIKYPADLIYTNLQMQLNLIHFAYKSKVKKLLFLGSSCAYPKLCPQPMKEEDLLSGPIEPTNEAYAIAKIAGMKMCQAYNHQYGTNFISVIPANLYGPNDNFDLETSHVIASLIRKFHEAKISSKKKVILWGTGAPRREFLYINDFVDACLFLMNNYNQPEIINVGSGTDISIRELSLLIKEVVGFDGKVVFDKTKPDGMPKKLLDTSKMDALGWKPKISLRKGLEKTYMWFRENEGKL